MPNALRSTSASASLSALSHAPLDAWRIFVTSAGVSSLEQILAASPLEPAFWRSSMACATAFCSPRKLTAEFFVVCPQAVSAITGTTRSAASRAGAAIAEDDI
jgi:hypothetical protein